MLLRRVAVMGDGFRLGSPLTLFFGCGRLIIWPTNDWLETQPLRILNFLSDSFLLSFSVITAKMPMESGTFARL